MPRRSSYLPLLLILPLALATTACDAGNGRDKVFGSVQVAAGQSASDATTVNGAVHVAANAKAADATTVNGSIELGDHASAANATTVNGGITLGMQASAHDLTTVNGSISLGDGAHVADDVTTVNGDVHLAQGVEVGGKAVNVNGHITLDDAHVGGGIETANGDIDIRGKSVVDGGILVKQSQGGGFLGIHFDSDHVPRIVIGPGATVNGMLKFERKVTLYISDQAHVAGPITGAMPVKFTGDTPPAN